MGVINNFRTKIRSTTLLGILLVLISLGSIAIVNYMQYRLVNQELSLEASQRNIALAASIAHEIDTTLELYFGTLSLLTTVEYSGQVALERLNRQFSQFEIIETSDKEGRIRFSSNPEQQLSLDISGQEYFWGAMQIGQPYLSSSFISERTYQPTVVLSVPGETGLAAGHLNLRSLGTYIQRLGQETYSIAVIDQNGYILAHSDDYRVYNRTTVALESWYQQARRSSTGSMFHEADESEWFTSWETSGYGEWLIAVSQPSSALLAKAEGLQSKTILVSLVFVMVAATITVVMIKLIAADITQLNRSAQALVAGKYDTQLHYHGFADLNPLADNFELMFEAVQNRESRLIAKEREILVSLREKEVLLKEIHHRVKNNLQLVISLLTLKAGTDDTLHGLFADSIDRIRVMSMIHEMLYKSADLASIDLGSYIRIITSQLLDNYPINGGSPILSTQLQPVEVDIDTAIPCGLIINELLTNSLKYAKPADGESLKIAIQLTATDNEATCILSDNGPGLPDGFKPENGHTLGMQLVLALVGQLKGRWEIQDGKGTKWSIQFPLSGG